MTKFEKNWITATLVPESICTRSEGKHFLHSLVNEKQENQTFVLESNDVLLVSADLKTITKSFQHTTFSSALDEIIPLLNNKRFR